MLGNAYNIVKEMIVKVGVVTIWDVGTRIHLQDAVKREIKQLHVAAREPKTNHRLRYSFSR